MATCVKDIASLQAQYEAPTRRLTATGKTLTVPNTTYVRGETGRWQVKFRHNGRLGSADIKQPKSVALLNDAYTEAMEAATAPDDGIANWPPAPHSISEPERWVDLTDGPHEPSDDVP
jgi:hypothetical protein